jgi:tripartite-type tricarboxylate transporter receptor subunit TctC
MPELPDVPAIAETWPEYEATSWFAMVAPPKTPPTIAAAISRAAIEALRAPDVSRKVNDLSASVVANTPEEMAAFMATEIAQWRKVIETARVKLD